MRCEVAIWLAWKARAVEIRSASEIRVSLLRGMCVLRELVSLVQAGTGAKALRFEALDAFAGGGARATQDAETLWLRYRCATHGGAIFKGAGLRQTGVVMADETAQQKDTMKVEKLSLLVLTLCIVVLVYVLVAHPF